MNNSSSDPVALADVQAFVLLRRGYAIRGLYLELHRTAPFVGTYVAQLHSPGEWSIRIEGDNLPFLLAALREDLASRFN